MASWPKCQPGQGNPTEVEGSLQLTQGLYSNTFFGRIKLLASPTNIRLGWKGMQETNTLAYYENP
jgi:hypothetical protein